MSRYPVVFRRDWNTYIQLASFSMPISISLKWRALTSSLSHSLLWMYPHFRYGGRAILVPKDLETEHDSFLHESISVSSRKHPAGRIIPVAKPYRTQTSTRDISVFVQLESFGWRLRVHSCDILSGNMSMHSSLQYSFKSSSAGAKSSGFTFSGSRHL